MVDEEIEERERASAWRYLLKLCQSRMSLHTMLMSYHGTDSNPLNTNLICIPRIRA